jgi:hypothetical protein
MLRSTKQLLTQAHLLEAKCRKRNWELQVSLRVSAAVSDNTRKLDRLPMALVKTT